MVDGDRQLRGAGGSGVYDNHSHTVVGADDGRRAGYGSFRQGVQAVNAALAASH